MFHVSRFRLTAASLLACAALTAAASRAASQSPAQPPAPAPTPAPTQTPAPSPTQELTPSPTPSPAQAPTPSPPAEGVNPSQAPALIEPAPTPMPPSAESVSVFAADCSTPKKVFNLGETVCTSAGGFPVALEPYYRRIQWVASDGQVAALTDVRRDPQTDKFVIPAAGDLARVGTWFVRTVNADASVNVLAKFVVRSRESAFSDLLVRHWGPLLVKQGERVEYAVVVENPGPDPARAVEFTVEVPANMIFLDIKQASGPAFECEKPAEGRGATITCRGRGLDLDGEAAFVIYYQVNPDAKDGSESRSVARVFSSTEELDKANNESAHVALVGDAVSRDETTKSAPEPPEL